MADTKKVTRATGNVAVRNPATGERVKFRRGSELPDWAVESLTKGNPSLLEPAPSTSLGEVPGPGQSLDDIERAARTASIQERFSGTADKPKARKAKDE